MSSDTELEARDIRAGYIAWCRGELPRDMAGEKFDRFIAKVEADAWDEGLQAGWEECQNPGPFVNDWWDSKAPNPHRIESGDGQ